MGIGLKNSWNDWCNKLCDFKNICDTIIVR